jgi:hypothetical protein
MRKVYVLLMVVLVFALNVFAQQRGQNAPALPPKTASLIFRETFQGRAPGAEAEIPLTTSHAANPNLELKLYGAGAKAQPDHESGLLLNNAADVLGGPDVSYIWSGVTEGNWVVTLRDKTNYADLTGQAKIRWRVRMRGFHALRPVIKLADGTLLVADYAEPESTYWRETEFYFVDIPRWRVLDPAQAVESRDAAWRTNVDLSKVDEIGFTDLARGAGHGQGGNSGVDWIEIYGSPVKR